MAARPDAARLWRPEGKVLTGRIPAASRSRISAPRGAGKDQ